MKGSGGTLRVSWNMQSKCFCKAHGCTAHARAIRIRGRWMLRTEGPGHGDPFPMRFLGALSILTSLRLPLLLGLDGEWPRVRLEAVKFARRSVAHRWSAQQLVFTQQELLEVVCMPAQGVIGSLLPCVVSAHDETRQASSFRFGRRRSSRSFVKNEFPWTYEGSFPRYFSTSGYVQRRSFLMRGPWTPFDIAFSNTDGFL